MPVQDALLEAIQQQNELNRQMIGLLRGLASGMGGGPEVETIHPGCYPTPPANVSLEDWLIIVLEGIVPAMGTTQIAKNISRESHFDWVYVTGVAYATDVNHHATLVPQTSLQVKIHDVGSDKYLMDGWLRWVNFIGDVPTSPPAGYAATPNVPYTIPGRRRFPVGSSISFEARDLSGVETYFEVALHGFKVYAQYQDKK